MAPTCVGPRQVPRQFELKLGLTSKMMNTGVPNSDIRPDGPIMTLIAPPSLAGVWRRGVRLTRVHRPCVGLAQQKQNLVKLC